MIFDRRMFFARLREKEPAPPWSIGLGVGLLVAYFLARVLSLAVLSILVDADAAAAGVFSSLTANLAANLAAIIGMLLLWLVLRRRVREPLGQALQAMTYRGSVVLLILFAVGAAILIDFIPLMFQTIGLPVHLQGLRAGTPAAWAAAGIFAVIVGPLFEMLLLQGVLYPALAATRDNIVAALLTALAYTALQVVDNPADPVLWGVSFLTGVFLSGLRAHQKSTRATIIAASMFGVFALFKALRLFL